MEIEFDEIPYDRDIFKVINNKNIIKDWILVGGEDYELIATVSEEVYDKLKQENFIKKIGIVTAPDNNPFAYIKFKDEKTCKVDSEFLDSSSSLFKHFK